VAGSVLAVALAEAEAAAVGIGAPPGLRGVREEGAEVVEAAD